MARVRGDRSKGDRGAVMVEFALVVPILLLLAMGIVEFGINFNRAQAVEAGAREGARVASLPAATDAQICQRVFDSLSGISIDDVTVTIDGGPESVSLAPMSEPCTGSGVQPCLDNDPQTDFDTVTVVVEAKSPLSIPFFGNRTINLSGKGDFLCEDS